LIYISKEQDKSMNRDKGSYQLSHIHDKLFAATTSGGKRSLVRYNSRCRNVNSKSKGCFWWIL